MNFIEKYSDKFIITFPKNCPIFQSLVRILRMQAAALGTQYNNLIVSHFFVEVLVYLATGFCV